MKNDCFSDSELDEKMASEAVSLQPKSSVVSVVSSPSDPILPCDSANNARDTGLVSRAVDLVVFESEATENDQNDCSNEATGSTESVADTQPDSLALLALVGTDDDPYQDGGPWAYANDPGGRCFMITQNLAHPSGQVLITPEQVAASVARKGIKHFAWIIHDKDVYTAAEVSENPALTVGAPKPPHVHIVIRRTSFASIAQVARSFGVPPQCVETKPPSAFLDLVEYLTHENAKQQPAGKHLYDDSEVHASKGWDWRADLEEHKAARLEKGLTKALQRRRKEAALKVAAGEWSLDHVRRHDLELWSSPGVMTHLKALRADFLSSLAPPLEVVNFYIFGPGGVGKDLLAHALARSLNPTAEKPYFTVGGSNVSFEDYDGEEVIIWSDFRAATMLDACRRDRGLLFRVLGPYRDESEKVIVNVKGSHTQLVNRVNIVTGPDDYKTFLDGLAGEYAYTNRMGVKVVQTSENKDQAYRRFPLIIPVEEGEFSIYVNLGFLKGTREFQQYERHERLRQSLEHVNRRCKAITDAAERESVVRQIEARTVAPILEQHARFSKSAEEPVAIESILDEFADEGSPVIDPEPTPEEIAAAQKQESEDAARIAAELAEYEAKHAAAQAEREQREAERAAAQAEREQREAEQIAAVLSRRRIELAKAGQLDAVLTLRVISIDSSDEIVDEDTGRVVTVPRAGGFVAVLPNEKTKEDTVRSPWSL